MLLIGISCSHYILQRTVNNRNGSHRSTACACTHVAILLTGLQSATWVHVHAAVLCNTTMVCTRSLGSLICLCSVNSIQMCDVALCKPEKSQGMSHVPAYILSCLVVCHTCNFYINNLEQQVQFNAKDCTFIAGVVFTIQAYCLLPNKCAHTVILVSNIPTSLAFYPCFSPFFN